MNAILLPGVTPRLVDEVHNLIFAKPGSSILYASNGSFETVQMALDPAAYVLRGQHPTLLRKASDNFPLEFLIKLERFFVAAQVVR